VILAIQRCSYTTPHHAQAYGSLLLLGEPKVWKPAVIVLFLFPFLDNLESYLQASEVTLWKTRFSSWGTKKKKNVPVGLHGETHDSLNKSPTT
jgi:hypothetical protein